MKINHIDEKYSILGEAKEECHYFSSLKKAFDYIDFFPPNYFSVLMAAKEKLPIAIRSADISDALDNRAIATKEIVSNQKGDLQSFVLCWKINDNKIPIPVFEQQTGFSLKDKPTLDNAANVFILSAKKEAPKSSQLQTNSLSKSKKSRGKKPK